MKAKNKNNMKKLVREYKIEDSIFFNSKYGEKVLSNMYPCRLEYGGQVFNSVEQLFYALLYKELLAKNMACNNAFEVKEMYKTYVMEKKASKLWGESNEDVKRRDWDRLMLHYRIIHLCHQVKFQQCKQFRDIIINSGEKDIVEWCYWINDKSIDTFGTYRDEERGSFIGINACGRSMMEVRREYRDGELEA